MVHTPQQREKGFKITSSMNVTIAASSYILTLCTQFVGICYPPQQLLPVMIMELMDESLTTYAEKPNINFKRRMSILHNVAEGLTYLHTHDPPVIHRDLSPNNILLKHLPLLPVAKIADLGVAKIINFDDTKSKEYLTKQPGTVHFMPPEALEDKPQYSTSLDVFSYHCQWEMAKAYSLNNI